MATRPKNIDSDIQIKIDKIKILIRQRKFAQALEDIVELQNRKPIPTFSAEEKEIYHLWAISLYGMGRYAEAKIQAEKAYDLLRNTSENCKLAEIQYTLGLIYLDLGDLRNAENYIRDAIATHRRIGNNDEIVTCYNKIARIFFVKSEFGKAIEYLNDAKQISETTGDPRMVAIISGNLGRIHLLMGNWIEAQDLIFSSLKFNERSGDELSLCRDQLSCGYVLCLKREFDQARQYLIQAFEIASRSNYLREMVIYHEYMGTLCFEMANYREAEDHYNQIIQLWQNNAPDGDMISQTYRLLAELQVAEKEWDKALQSCRKSLEVSRPLGEKIEEGVVYRILGQIHSFRGEKDNAAEYFKQSITILQQVGAKGDLAKTYLEAGRSNSFDYYKRLGYLSNAESLFRDLKSKYHLS